MQNHLWYSIHSDNSWLCSKRARRDRCLLIKGWSSLATESGVVSGVIRATESDSEESERFHFFRLRRLRSAYDLLKTWLSESEAEAEG